MPDDDTAREVQIHKSGSDAAASDAIEAIAAAVVAKFPGSVSHDSHGQAVVYVDRAAWHDVALHPPRRGALHAVPRRDRRRPPPRRDAPRGPGCRARALRGRRQLPLAPAQPPHPHDLRGPGRRHDRRQHRRRVRRGRLRRARGLRPVRRHLRGAPRPHADPHARRLGRAPAAQGRRPGTDPRDLQRGPRARDEHRHTVRDEQRLETQTDEGAQLLQPREQRDLVVTGGLWPDDTETTIINMGPQHPSTHGVLRVMLELDGETVLRLKPVIGYLHTGMEKTAEELTYVQGATNVTRMDYVSPLSNELVWSMAVEQLLDLELPPRATWIRMFLVELNRIASHLLFQATNGMDIGALSMMIYGWRDREETLRLLEKITGLRMNHNFIRPGGVAADLPDGWEEDTLELARPRREGCPRLRGAAEREPDLARAARRRRHHHDRAGARARRDRPDPAFDRLPVGPAQGAAVPRVRRGRLRRRVHRRTATATTASSSGSTRSPSR